MTVSPYASDAMIAETEAVIGQSIASNEQQLLQQICLALGNRNAGGSGDPLQNTLTALGADVLASTTQGLLQQILVLAATNP